MCMEDVRIGRRKVTRFRFVDVPTTWTKICDANSMRTYLLIQNISTSSSFVWFEPNVSTSTGIHVTRTIPPLELDIEKHGQCVASDIYAIASGAAQRLVILETILQES
jgi:hypothetical protein